jgi:chromosome segregation ATPase
MASYDKTKTAQIDQLNELLEEHKKRISELANERDHLRDELENRVRDVANLQEALALATNKNPEDGEVAGDVSMASVTSEAIKGTPRSARKRRDFGGKSKISETLAQQIRQNEELNNGELPDCAFGS